MRAIFVAMIGMAAACGPVRSEELRLEVLEDHVSPGDPLTFEMHNTGFASAEYSPCVVDVQMLKADGIWTAVRPLDFWSMEPCEVHTQHVNAFGAFRGSREIGPDVVTGTYKLDAMVFDGVAFGTHLIIESNSFEVQPPGPQAR